VQSRAVEYAPFAAVFLRLHFAILITAVENEIAVKGKIARTIFRGA
jgi:hypothetical protein